MKTFYGIALGFLLTPATILLIALFAWLSITFQLSKVDTAIGSALGIFCFAITALIVFKLHS